MDEQRHLIDDILGLGVPYESDDMPDPGTLRRHAKRRMLRMGQRDSLRDKLGALPEPGESVHIISAAKWDFWTWTPELVAQLGRLDEWYCSTWTASRAGIVELFELIDDDKIAGDRVGMLTGLYFKRRETSVYALMVEGLQRRGGRYRCFENHCKVQLLAGGGCHLVIEGSANLTSNPRFEQYVVTNDRPLYDFHRQWFEEMLRGKTKNGG